VYYRLLCWLEETAHAPPWLVGAYCWPRYRLASRCLAQGCQVPGRLQILHGPRRLRRCETTPMAIVLTEQGLAAAVVAEAEELTVEAAGS
jgi:hypothetical protein